MKKLTMLFLLAGCATTRTTADRDLEVDAAKQLYLEQSAENVKLMKRLHQPRKKPPPRAPGPRPGKRPADGPPPGPRAGSAKARGGRSPTPDRRARSSKPAARS